MSSTGMYELLVALVAAPIVAAFLMPIGIEIVTGVAVDGMLSGPALALWELWDVALVLVLFTGFTGLGLRVAR